VPLCHIDQQSFTKELLITHTEHRAVYREGQGVEGLPVGLGEGIGVNVISGYGAG